MNNVPFDQRKVLADEASAKGLSLPVLLRDRLGTNASQRMVHDLEWAAIAQSATRDDKNS